MAKKFCESCGTSMLDTLRICPQCGGRVFSDNPKSNLDIHAGADTPENNLKINLASQSNTNTIQINYAKFWERFAAAIIDINIILLISLVFGFFVGMFLPALGLSVTSKKVEAFFKLLDFGIAIFYYSHMESGSSMGTYGKQWIGLKVSNLNYGRITLGQGIGRYFARWISLLLVYIGYLIQPFNAKKQTLHDMMAGTLVLRTQQPKSGIKIFFVSILGFFLLCIFMVVILAINKTNF